MTIVDNLAGIRAEIRALEQKYGRRPGSVDLLAVSKTRPVEALRAALDAGQLAFGENYWQEAEAKLTALRHPDLRWHFIGPVQTNKTRPIAVGFDWAHSVARLKVARRLHDARPETLPPLNICVQVNVDGEASKAGIALTEVGDFIAALRPFKRLAVRGLMALPAPRSGLEAQRRPFAALRACLAGLTAQAPQLDTLSMGTSQDMEAAIAEGATIVRIGTALFGPREY